MVLADPDKCVRVENSQSLIRQGMIVESIEKLMIAKQGSHARIQVDQQHLLDSRVAQHFARSQTVAATKDQDPARLLHATERGVHQRLVVAIFVTRREL